MSFSSSSRKPRLKDGSLHLWPYHHWQKRDIFGVKYSTDQSLSKGWFPEHLSGKWLGLATPVTCCESGYSLTLTNEQFQAPCFVEIPVPQTSHLPLAVLRAGQARVSLQGASVPGEPPSLRPSHLRASVPATSQVSSRLQALGCAL